MFSDSLTMKRLTLLAIALLATLCVAAQNFYPGKEGVLKGDGYTYIYRSNIMGGKILHNIEMPISTNTQYKDPNNPPQGLRHFSKVNVTHSELNALVLNQLSSEHKKMLVGRQFAPMMTIDSQTGKVVEVWFILSPDEKDPRNRIPVDVYRRIEVALKERVVFTTTEECRNLVNYFFYPVMLQF